MSIVEPLVGFKSIKWSSQPSTHPVSHSPTMRLSSLPVRDLHKKCLRPKTEFLVIAKRQIKSCSFVLKKTFRCSLILKPNQELFLHFEENFQLFLRLKPNLQLFLCLLVSASATFGNKEKRVKEGGKKEEGGCFEVNNKNNPRSTELIEIRQVSLFIRILII